MIVHEFEQNSREWFEARLGIPTASMFSAIMAKGEGKTRRTYMLKLAGERITGEPMSNYSNADMERGHEMEEEARQAWAEKVGVVPEQVGFITNDEHTYGASPDSLVGKAGLLEIKTKVPHLLIDEILRDRPPPMHLCQVQGQLWVSERDYCNLVLYWPNMPIVTFHIDRDEAFIKKIASEVNRFNDELDEMVEEVRKRFY